VNPADLRPEAAHAVVATEADDSKVERGGYESAMFQLAGSTNAGFAPDVQADLQAVVDYWERTFRSSQTNVPPPPWGLGDYWLPGELQRLRFQNRMRDQ
jgi:hypothetical protein